jgi:hypothetical protein
MMTAVSVSLLGILLEWAGFAGAMAAVALAAAGWAPEIAPLGTGGWVAVAAGYGLRHHWLLSFAAAVMAAFIAVTCARIAVLRFRNGRPRRELYPWAREAARVLGRRGTAR